VGRQLGERDGVCIPLQAAEHYYLITDTVPGMAHDLAVIEDPDRYGYYRPRATACWSACSSRSAPVVAGRCRTTSQFGTLRRMGPPRSLPDAALARIPSSEVGVRLFFCGPESFTPDIRPMLGPAPELDAACAAGMNCRILTGAASATDGTGSSTACHPSTSPVAPSTARPATDLPAVSRRPHRRATRRAVRRAVWPTWKPGSARDAALGADDRPAGARVASVGWEFAEWYDTDGEHPATTPTSPGSPPSTSSAASTALREDVGVLDMSLMAKFLVQGPDAEVLERLRTRVAARSRAGLARNGLNTWRIAADLTVTRLGAEKFSW
jgi:4-methylaminobutanoate oxidase (formaldehyde-forming)